MNPIASRVRLAFALSGLAAAAAAPAAHAQLLQPAFTYQGRLTDGGAPANGAYDFQFRLFDASGSGTQFGPTVVVNDLAVVNGLFSTKLNFGTGQFWGEMRWLQIEARAGASTGAYTVLTPRQELTPSPYSLGPWQLITGAGHPANGYRLSTGSADLWVDSLNGDLNFNGGSDGFFGLYNRGVATGRTEFLSARGVNLSVVNQTGNVGVNTPTPDFRLHVSGGPSDQYTLVVQNRSTAGGNAVRGVIEANGNGNFSAGVVGVNNAPAGPSGGFAMYAEHTAGGTGIRAIGTGPAHGVEGYAVGVNGWGGYFKNLAGGVALFADGLAMVRTLQILGGSDLAEPFDVAAAGETLAEPGMLVVIDAANPGHMKVSTEPYDSKVAGAISGANGLQPGMVMKAEGTDKADGDHPVAMTGRVWVWCDASEGAIEPGDRLTTSATPGHAMNALDKSRADGAVIGKAMTALKDGRGLVLVLVNLQ